MQFVKMHALGNDYLYIDAVKSEVSVSPELIRRMSDRHTGIGADGVILILPSEEAICRMQMFNADGSEAQMCGNGMRCIAKYVYEAGYTMGTESFEIETAAGVPVEERDVEGVVVGDVVGGQDDARANNRTGSMTLGMFNQNGRVVERFQRRLRSSRAAWQPPQQHHADQQSRHATTRRHTSLRSALTFH